MIILQIVGLVLLTPLLIVLGLGAISVGAMFVYGLIIYPTQIIYIWITEGSAAVDAFMGPSYDD